MKKLLGLALLLSLGADGARAQAASGPIVLDLPASTRALALGNAFVTVGGDPDAIFYNPALLTAARGIAVAAQRYGSASTAAAASAAMEMAPGGLGIGIQVLDYGARSASGVRSGAPLPEGGVAGLFERGPDLASNLVASIGYARPIKGVRVGLAGKLIEQRLGQEKDETFAVDVGAAANVAVFTVAVAVRNLGPGLDVGGMDGASLELPRRFVLSASHPSRIVGPFDLVTALAVAADEDGTVLPALGAELAWWPVVGKTFIARAGLRRTSDTESGRPVTLGAGFTGDRFSLDYAFEPFDRGRAAHRLGVRWR